MKWFGFLHAYAILMMFAPVINRIMEFKDDALSLVLPILVLVFGWSYCYEVGHIRPYMFPSAGLGSHTSLCLIGIYVAAGLFRLYNIEDRIKVRVFVIGLVFSLPFAVIGLASYNTVFAFVIASSLFVLYKKYVRCGEWIAVLSPSMFAVYCLHSTKPGLDLIKFSTRALPLGSVINVVITGAYVFAFCLIIDMTRRFALIILKKVCK